MNKVVIDWSVVENQIKDGSINLIDPGVKIRYWGNIMKMHSFYLKPPMRPAVEVYVVIGPTGTGKTHWCHEAAGDNAYLKCSRVKWWDSYKSEENVIIDEFAGMIDITYLLKWFDVYRCTVEIKGGQVALFAKKFWVTSNLEIDEWFPNAKSEHVLALKRRVTNVIKMTTRFVEPIEIASAPGSDVEVINLDTSSFMCDSGDE
jgi:hypothetical protein